MLIDAEAPQAQVMQNSGEIGDMGGNSQGMAHATVIDLALTVYRRDSRKSLFHRSQRSTESIATSENDSGPDFRPGRRCFTL